MTLFLNHSDLFTNKQTKTYELKHFCHAILTKTVYIEFQPCTQEGTFKRNMMPSNGQIKIFY